MSLPNQEFPLSRQTPNKIQEVPSPGISPNDSLIAKGWQREQYIGIAIFLASLIAAIGFFSRRFEYAVIFAVVLSIILMFLFFIV